jgi:hypothetical protein
MMKRPSPSLAISLLALFVALGGAGIAANGGPLLLGRINGATVETMLVAPIGTPAFRVQNTNAGPNATALNLIVAAGKPPMKVNSAGLVQLLNADRLDGRHANEVLRVARAGLDESGTGLVPTDKVTVTLNVPSTGFVLVTGTTNVVTTDSTCNPCYLHQRLRDPDGNFSLINFTSVGNGTLNITRSIATNTWVFPVTGPGSRTFGLQAAATDPDVGLENATITALFVPFGPTGDLTGITAVSSASEAPRLGRMQRDGTRQVLH